MLENNSSRLIFAAIAVLVGGAIYGTVNVAYPDATNQIIKKIQEPFTETEDSSDLNHKNIISTLDIPYGKIPNQSGYFSGFYNEYSLSETNDDTEKWNSSTMMDFFSSNTNIINGIKYQDNGMVTLNNVTTENGKKYVTNNLKSISEQPVYLLKNNQLKLQDAGPMNQNSITSMSNTGYKYDTKPEDFDIVLNQVQSVEQSDDNLALFKKEYQNIDLDNNMYGITSQTFTIHVHYYESQNIGTN